VHAPVAPHDVELRLPLAKNWIKIVGNNATDGEAVAFQETNAFALTLCEFRYREREEDGVHGCIQH
jgi:hypothetical protein